MNSLIKWLSDGNDCGKCGAIWEEWSAYHEDCDCGCYIKGTFYDEKPCRIPRPIRWLLIRRAEYFKNHEYDGIGDFYDALEQENEKCRKAIEEMLNGRVICWKESNGKLHECNTEMIIFHDAWKVRDAIKPEYQPPPTLRQRWKTLLYDTLMVIPNAVKPFICK